MSNFLTWLTDFNNSVNGFVWGKGLYLLLITGVVMTVVTGVFQITKIRHWFSETLGSLFKKDVSGHVKGKSISQFQALCTALAATIGVGNIAGVAAAIVGGGPGAVFWMWIAAFFGMMTNYSENVLGIYFRRKNNDGEWSGGAMYYLRDGLGGYEFKDKNTKVSFKPAGKVLAVLFCIFTMLASFGIGSMGQVNKIVANVASAFEAESLSSVTILGGISLYNLIIGVVVMALAALIILGGLKRIASVAEKIVPFMVVLFVVGSLVIIGTNYQHIIPAFESIFVNAFSPEAFVGGGVGGIIVAMTNGFKRGVFSNEAGLGSSVMVHSNSTVKEPVKQGMWGIFEVFADTMIVCTMTALVVLTSGIFNAMTGVDDFELAKECDVFASTNFAQPIWSVLTLSAGAGKTCYNVECHVGAGTTKMHQKQIVLKDLAKELLPQIGMGIKGFMFWQYRPEILGFESPAWGVTKPDGTTGSVGKAAKIFIEKLS
ncbi:MAG: amino acid carrier protein, partial [Lachnospiraceae bacterium]|nr:amino acid carrier protein [Lachnospiraceae bacterium]